jgi:hypothetical protein
MGGILDRAIQILRARFTLFAGIAVFPGLAQLVWQLLSVHPNPGIATIASDGQTAFESARYGASFVFSVASLVLQAIATAASCLAASRVYFGDSITIRSAFGTFTSKAGRLVGLEILRGIYAGWPLMIAAFVAVVIGELGGSIYLQVPVWILGSIPCLALYSRYALAFPACAIENLSAPSAIDRSVNLSQGGRWRICGGFVFPGTAAAVFTYSLIWLIARLKTGSPFLAGSPFVVAGLNGIVSFIGDLVFVPLSAIVLTVLYYDQRIRREGYDVERMMDAAGMTAPGVSLASDSPIASAAPEEVQP